MCRNLRRIPEDAHAVCRGGEQGCHASRTFNQRLRHSALLAWNFANDENIFRFAADAAVNDDILAAAVSSSNLQSDVVDQKLRAEETRKKKSGRNSGIQDSAPTSGECSKLKSFYLQILGFVT